MPVFFSKHLSFLRGGPSLALLSTLTLGLTFLNAAPLPAELFNSPVDKLPVAERVSLRKGEAIVTGDKGIYTGRILVATTPEVVWAVLTDYASFPRILPNVVSSQVLSTEGNRKVIEQVDVRPFLLVNVRSRVRTTVTETDKNRIDFRLVEGDLQKLQGYWEIQPISPYAGAAANQVLITQVVEAQPSAGIPKDIFYGIFKNTLGKNLNALRQEMLRRSPSSSMNEALPKKSS
ncbi:MAG: SRPBCC family protein [Scytolyngbya sp. HA4215-MV1]|jgi:ribosome-associated toxin RatA of RatAB toxin-antitoxin module|nr:SRPBCC family protein [Scytolyngbya sp. HA4215-MV1]